MFGGVHEVSRQACERKLVTISAEQARLAQRVTLLVRQADERGYWRAAGLLVEPAVAGAAPGASRAQ
jgi:hypothetical protein